MLAPSNLEFKPMRELNRIKGLSSLFYYINSILRVDLTET